MVTVAEIMAFLTAERTWDHIPIGLLKSVVSRCHDLGQIELLRTDPSSGPADILVVWSWLKPEAEQRYAKEGFAGLRPADIGKDGNLWLIVLSAPGGAEHLAAALAWAGKNIPADDGKERFRCLASLEPNKDPQPVAFILTGESSGSIKPVHI